MVIPIKLRKPPDANDVACALVCVYTLLVHHNIRLNWQRFVNSLSVNEFGYDTLEIAAGLLDQSVDLDVFHYDTDYIKRSRKEKYFFDLAWLHQQRAALSDKLSEQNLESLDANISFLSKHSNLLIGPVRTKLLIETIKSGTAPIIHVDMFFLTKDKNHTMHSIVLNGVWRKSFTIIDPLIGERLVDKKKIIKAWRAAGSYTLVIKGKREAG